MGHACEMETSILLARYPQQGENGTRQGGAAQRSGIRLSACCDMLKSPPFFLINEFDELSPNGVLGMPELATAEKGEQFLDAAAQAVNGFIREFASWDFQTRPPA